MIAAGFMFVYTCLDWWLVIRLDVIPWKEEVTHFWLPYGLAWVPVLIWLRPCIRLLDIIEKRRFGYLFIASIAISIPTLLLQDYLETSTGELTTLSKISQIGTVRPTKYYTVQRYYAEKELAQIERSAIQAGGRSSTLTYHIYISTPLFDKRVIVLSDTGKATRIGEATKITPKQDPVPVIVGKNALGAMGKLPDTIQNKQAPPIAGNPSKALDPGEVSLTIGPIDPGQPRVWLCIHYERQLKKNLEPSEKDRIWKDFFQVSWQDFKEVDFNRAFYLDRIGNTENRDNYEIAAQKSSFYPSSPDSAIILEPRYALFSERNGHKLDWAFLAFGIGAGIFFILLLFVSLDKSKMDY